MNIYLKTRDECQAIVKASDAFYCTETIVQGFKVEMYDYRLASYTDFEEHQAWELRGLTFVYNPTTKEWERHLALQKFFNCNQTIGYMYEDLIKLPIEAVHNKLDGSMITFVKLPNGNIVAKTKMSFISPQAVMAQDVYEKNKKIKTLVNDSIDSGDTCIFELISPHNQIVLEYPNTNLIFLQIRDTDGNYHPIREIVDEYKVQGAMEYLEKYRDLDVLLKLKTEQILGEGWVVTTKEGHYKIKTDWYISLQGLVTEGTRENLLIKTILDKNIDDVLVQLQEGEKKEFMVATEKIVNEKFNTLVVEFKELRRKYFQDFGENRREFAIKHSKDELFSSVMKTLNTSFRDVEQTAEEQVYKHIEHITRSLDKAREWLK